MCIMRICSVKKKTVALIAFVAYVSFMAVNTVTGHMNKIGVTVEKTEDEKNVKAGNVETVYGSPRGTD